MSDTSESDGSRYDALRDQLRSALPLSGSGKHLTRRRFFQTAMAAGAAALAVARLATRQALLPSPICYYHAIITNAGGVTSSFGGGFARLNTNSAEWMCRRLRADRSRGGRQVGIFRRASRRVGIGDCCERRR
jgi:hypothetical protein